MRNAFGGRWLSVALVAMTFFGVTSAIAYAAGLFGGGSMISACVDKRGGAVRIVAAGEACANGERALSWAQDVPAIPQARAAWAHFSSGTLDAGRSQNVTDWSRFYNANQGLAIYCVKLAFPPKNVSASGGFYTSGDSSLYYSAGAPNASLTGEQTMRFLPCPSASAAMAIREQPNSSYADFYVTFTG